MNKIIFILIFYLSFLLYGVENPFIVKNFNGFEKNFGQAQKFGKEKVIFFIRDNNLGIFLTEKGLNYIIYGDNGYSRIKLELIGSNLKEENIYYEEEQPGYSNYYLSNFPNGILNVKSYKKIIIKEIYPNVNWLFKYDNGEIHQEFEVGKDASLDKIRFKVRYADLEIKENGKKIVFLAPFGKVEEGELIGISGKNKINISYKRSKNIISFYAIGWDRKEKLIIDPPLKLVWSTYYGGSSFDYPITISSDVFGNVFVAGYTFSMDFPLQDPGEGSYFQDNNLSGKIPFILKFTNDGVREWATFYGGHSYNYIYSLATDNSGNLFATGCTLSYDFPTQDAGGGAYYQDKRQGFSDAFILKFDNNGLRKWATYYGGDADECGNSITTDIFGNIFVAGKTSSSDFPTQDPGGGAYYNEGRGNYDYDIFILKFTNEGKRIWGTYYGGTNDDEAFAITTDKLGNLYITGNTLSVDFPVKREIEESYQQESKKGKIDGFILKFSNSGVWKWATYYGGSLDDTFLSITADNIGNLFLTGYTWSKDFPLKGGEEGSYFQKSIAGAEDSFILKFTNEGVRKWATYYGGSNSDFGICIAYDNSNNIYLSGHTESKDFPIYNPNNGNYFQEIFKAGDAFILEFTNEGAIEWATYYGGSNSDFGNNCLAIDKFDNIFLIGSSRSIDLPIVKSIEDSYCQDYNDENEYGDGFIAKFGIPSMREEYRIIIPAVIKIEETNSSNWKTDIQLFNPTNEIVNYKINFIISGIDEDTTPYRYDGIIERNSILIFNDIVNEIFGLKQVYGAVLIEANGPIIATARTYSQEKGSYGQFIKGYYLYNALDGKYFIRENEKGHIFFLINSNDFRTNLGFMEVKGKEIKLNISIYDDFNNLLGLVSYSLPPFGFLQVNDLFNNLGINGIYDKARAEVEVEGEGAVFAYASVVDNYSNDCIFVPFLKEENVKKQSIAVLVKKGGDRRTFWKSDLGVFNPKEFPQEIILNYIENGFLYSKKMTLEGKKILVARDAIKEIFGLEEGLGNLQIIAPEGVLSASRIYTTTEKGSYGQFVPSTILHIPLKAGEEKYILHLSSNDLYRTNIGMSEISGNYAAIQVILYNSEGVEVGARIYTLSPYEFKQINGVFDAFKAGKVDNGYAKIIFLSGDGEVMVYASVVDNETGDAIYVISQ